MSVLNREACHARNMRQKERGTMRIGAGCLWLSFLWLLVQGSVAQAQIRVAATLDQRSFVVGEPIMVTATIENQTSVPLVFGSQYHNADLFLEVSRTRSIGPAESNRRRVQRDTVLMPRSQMRELIEATTIYTYLQAGNYRLRVIVKHEGYTYSSQPFVFDVASGIEMQSLRHMLPYYDDIELRFSVRYANRSGREEAFFVIESPALRDWYGTYALGPVLRIYQPAIRVREDGRVVVVHQSGRSRFTRSTFRVDREGSQFVEQRHFRPDGTPIQEGR